MEPSKKQNSQNSPEYFYAPKYVNPVQQTAFFS